MKRLNNKGFSMVEILAVVVILGVISTVGIVTISRLVDNSRIRYYETQKDQLVLAAQSYANDNKNILPKTIGTVSTISLKELKDKNYIKEEIVDQNKNKCYEEEQVINGKKVKGSRVDIYKSTKTDYIYVGHLECVSCQKDNEKDNDYSCSEKLSEEIPYIKISIPKMSDLGEGQSIYDESKKIEITIDAIEKKLGYDKKVLVSSYSYKIYVDGVIKQSSGLKINNKQDQVKINKETIGKYLPGKVKVVVTATNTNGQTTTKSSTVNLSDAAPPLCGRVSYEGSNKMNPYNSGESVKCGSSGYSWINIGYSNKTRQGWIVCNDQKGLGCAQHEYSVNMTTEGENEIVKMKDAKGNEQECRVRKCIDTTTPKLTVNIFKLPSNGKVPLKSDGTVNLTPVKSYVINSQSSAQKLNKTDKFDTWLNKANYAYGVIVEAIVEESNSKIKTFSWYQNPKNKKENKIGNATEKVRAESNITKTKYPVNQIIKDDGVRKEEFKIIDNAGNEVSYTLTLKIDRTAPQPPTISMYLESSATGTATGTPYSNNTWKNKYVWTNTNHPTDSPDVSGWKNNQYKTTGAHGNNTDKVGNSLNISKEGTSTITYRACDNAGNCSNYASAKTIKLDRTKPTCTIVGNNKWDPAGAYVHNTCSKNDNYSNISSCPNTTSFYTTKNVTYYATDEAGNKSNACTYVVQKCTQHSRRNCAEYNRSSSCPCETYKECRRESFGDVTKTYSNSDDVCSSKSVCDNHIEKGIKWFADQFSDGTYATFKKTYTRNHNVDGHKIASSVQGCSNVNQTTTQHFVKYKTVAFKTLDRDSCFASKTVSGNFNSSGRYDNNTCYIGVHSYYWTCNTSSHKKKFKIKTFKKKRDSKCGCETYKACAAAGCKTWGAWSAWSCDTTACSGNSCQSQARTAYK